MDGKRMRCVAGLAVLRQRISAVALLVLALAAFGPAAPVRAATLCVNPAGSGACHAKIQDAVNAASAGDTITVAARTYNESITIGKAVTLQGAGPTVATIDAGGAPNAVHITASQVTLTGFTIKDAQMDGVLIEGASNMHVASNTIRPMPRC